MCAYISLTRPRTAIKLYAHTYCTHMRGVRDKADFCCDYSWIEDLLLLRMRIVIARQKLQQRTKQLLIRYTCVDKNYRDKEKAREVCDNNVSEKSCNLNSTICIIVACDIFATGFYIISMYTQWRRTVK